MTSSHVWLRGKLVIIACSSSLVKQKPGFSERLPFPPRFPPPPGNIGTTCAWLYFQNQHSTASSRQMSDMQNPQDPKTLIKKVLAPIAQDMAAVDAVIRSELASDVPRMKEISEYITSAGGKRMRPALLMLICRALGYEGTLHQYLGATIELLHTATLMHDDVVDESDMRRGRPTANSRWGNGAAVLVGDFLYTRSFQMMVKAGNLRVMEALSDAANRLSEGEVVQMVNAHDPSVDEARYFLSLIHI